MNRDIDRDKLVTDNLALVGYVLKRILHYPAVAALGWDDAYSAGNVALVNSAKRFDQTMGFKFTTYACRAIKTEIFRTANREMKHLLPQSIGFDVADQVNASEWDTESVPRILNRLSNPRDAELVRRYYGLGQPAMTLEAIAGEMNVSQQMASHMHRRALAEMREGL